MAAGSLLALFDDIATVLDDVAVMTKIAAKKTAGVLGDDLALNAEQVSGVRAEREIPVVWAVAKGSFKNKLILVPAALVISAVAPWLILPMLMLGGAFLCYEGFEKIAHKFLHDTTKDEAHHKELTDAVANPEVDMVEFEKTKIQGAIRTDFILSAEIIVIALGTVAESDFITRVLVVSGIAVIITIGVYGLVAGIVKMDDAGLYLTKLDGQGVFATFRRWLGRVLLTTAPLLMKTLTIVGTAAMFMVGGGILVHGIAGAEEAIHHIAESAGQVKGIGFVLEAIVPTLISAIGGIIAGAILVPVVGFVLKLFGKSH